MKKRLFAVMTLAISSLKISLVSTAVRSMMKDDERVLVRESNAQKQKLASKQKQPLTCTSIIYDL